MTHRELTIITILLLALSLQGGAGSRLYKSR